MSYEPPFGRHWTTKNLFQKYYIPIVQAIESEDWLYLKQLRDELYEMDMGMEKYHYIWRHLASDTRAKANKGEKDD